MAAPVSPSTSYFVFTPETDLGGGVKVKFGKVHLFVQYSSGQVVGHVWASVKDASGNRKQLLETSGPDIVTCTINLTNLMNALL